VIVQHRIEAGSNVMATDDELETPLYLALKDLDARESKIGTSEPCCGYSLAVPTRMSVTGKDRHLLASRGGLRNRSKISVYEAGCESR
jgi:hypothetical protein